MNLVLVTAGDLVAEDRVRLAGRRFEHLRKVLKAREGDTIRVGILGGNMGTGRIVAMGAGACDVDLRLTEPPPPPAPVTLVLALPRAASLKKVLQQCAAMGIKRFLLIGAQRVEKSYWSSSALDDDSMKDHLCLGLEQARDTVLPVVEVFRRFRAFVDERLAGLLAEGTGYLASPEAAAPFPSPPRLPAFVVLGPEGGFMPGETARLVDAGLFPVSLGPRILRVETAAVAMVARALA